MNKFIFAVLALIVLLIAIVVIAPGLVPVGTYKGRIEAAASNALGREVTIGDDLSFKIVPQTAFHVTSLEIANADGFDAPYLARVASADIGVKLFPLFSGSVELDRFVLTEPEINLARNAAGEVNWNFAQDETVQSEEQAEQSGDNGLRDLRLGDVRIVDGRAMYADAAADRTFSAENIDAAIRLASLEEPLEVDGTMVFEGAPTKVDIVLTSLGNILRKEEANLKLDMTLGDAQAGADLAVQTGETLSYTGPVSLNAPDLPAFAALMGAPLADAPGFDTLAVKGTAAGSAEQIRLTGAAINFDKIDAEGDLGLDWSGVRPKATGRLAANSLDLRPYMPPPSEDAQGFPAWSAEPMDFTGLRNIDADIDLTADKIFLNEMEFGESRMQLAIDGGRMVAEIPELGMYGGAGSGRLVVDARQATPAIAGKFDVDAVEAQPFSKDLFKSDRLLGLGGFNLQFNAQGASQAAIMQSLNGAGGFDVEDGALKGINIAKLARAIDQVRQGGLNPTAITTAISEAQKPDEQTDFSEMLSQFSITNGLVSAPTISLEGPFLTMSGKGAIDLPGQKLDLRLQPRATTTMDGEGGRALAIPMRVTGTFSQPRIVIDAEALLRGRAEEGLKSIIDGFSKRGGGSDSAKAGAGSETKEKTNPSQQILEGVLGGGQSSGTDTDAEQSPPDSGEEAAAKKEPSTEDSATAAIRQIFGGKTRSEETEKTDETPE